MLGKELEARLDHALALARERNQQYATLEHLLLALLDDRDTEAALIACRVGVDRLRRQLLDYIDTQLDSIKGRDGEEPRPTAGFQRALQRAAIHVQSSGGDTVAGTDLLLAVFSEHASAAARYLREYGVTKSDLANYLDHGLAKRDPARRR